MLDEDAARPFFKRAIENGINFFDTANMYSLGVSEEVTGRALRDFGNFDEIVLATKVFFPINDRPNMGGLSRKHIVQACEASLRRLGVDTIDLYQIHRFDPSTPLEETLAALDHLVRQGKVRYLGASTGTAWQFARALSASEREGWARFVTMQNHYNLLYREEEREMNPLCEAAGVGLVPWSPLARGLLAGSRRSPAEASATNRAESDDFTRRLYDPPGDAVAIDAVRAVADRLGTSMAEVALAWLLRRPAVVAPIVGATKLSHLDSAIRALDVVLSDEDTAALEAPYQPHDVRG
ncbi:MAG: aldo/keto reductase [Gemmatimonadaceae bacterium]